MASINDQTHIVKRRSVLGHHIRLDLESGDSITTRRFVPVSVGAILTETQGSLSLRVADGSDVQISPAWKQTVHLQVGDTTVTLVIKEIESKSELEAFSRLTKYHYRGARSAGRTVPLIISAIQDDLPDALGFIELTTSFLVNSARQKILDAAFSDPAKGIGWTRWDSETARKWINCIARISRCVVFPEFRGLGLSSLLVEAAVQYAKERWHIGGLRPIFLEITADMLRYWPFVRKAGFVYIGDTEGNGHRAAKDMSYLVRKSLASHSQGLEGMPRGGGGILSHQRSRAAHLCDVVDRAGLSFEEIIDHLKTSPDRLSDDAWFLLHSLYRRPKPTYMRGLTSAAEEFVLRRVASSNKIRSAGGGQNSGGIRADEPVLQIHTLSITTQTKPVSSNRSRRLQEAFGIVSEQVELPIIENLDLLVSSGEVVLVTGPSGSGKSLLLEAIKLLTKNRSSLTELSEINIVGKLHGNNPSVGVPKSCDPSIAPIDALNWLSMEDALQVMAVSGLAEPQVLIRSSRTLSLGQRYRLSLALGLAEDVDLFLVDEFCEPLDRYSTAAVARHLRREADLRRMAVIVATSRPDLVASSLKPDRTLILSSDAAYTWR